MYRRSLRWTTLASALVLTATVALAPPSADPAAANPATGTITGHLTDETGAPLVEASVTAYDDEINPVASGQTDSAGRYSLDVPPGTYRVRILADDFGQWIPQQQYAETAQEFAVTSGGTVVVDDSLVPTGSIAGRIVNQAGQPVRDHEVATRNQGQWGPTARTDNNGNYRISRVFPGDYLVGVRHPANIYQWAPGQLAENLATVFTVSVGNQTTVNETLLGSGSVAGRFLDATGAGVADALVFLSDDNDVGLHTYTDGSGAYRFDGVTVGDAYIVRFSDPASNRQQYAYGTADYSEATRFTVLPGATTTVDDTLLIPGSIRVTATDAATGTPLSTFCADYSGPSSTANGCTTNSEVVFTGLSPGSYVVTITPEEGSLYLGNRADATVTPGGTAQVTVPLHRGGAITATATARATGAPVAWACYSAIAAGTGTVPTEGYGWCTDRNGQATTGVLAPGDYHLLVQPVPATGYGMQWLGATGGTGAAANAVRITVTAGQVATAPPVLLDPAGSITGVVRGADGTPLPDVMVALSDVHPGYVGGKAVTDEDGSYTVTGLGPYAWPLHFVDDQHARQWSGGTGNRLVAKKIKVTAGAAASYDIKLKTGTLVTGTIRDRAGAEVTSSYLLAYSALTRDIVGVKWDTGGTYQMRLIAPELVKVQVFAYVDDQNFNFWYDNGTDFDTAQTLAVPWQGRTLDVVVPVN
ncbi:carboxypeptidase regulatory-like domain-containing protein [Polymorphospora sp. NPDC050346]|uniref:MSCRAMM family protein n=1 Tax=Polymorphospora sp. NPDC050346 TaxID=3155780 RepID=UPI0033C76F76